MIGKYSNTAVASLRSGEHCCSAPSCISSALASDRAESQAGLILRFFAVLCRCVRVFCHPICFGRQSMMHFLVQYA